MGKMGDFSNCEILRSLDVAFSPSEIGDKGHLGEGGWKLEIYQSVEVEPLLPIMKVLFRLCHSSALEIRIWRRFWTSVDVEVPLSHSQSLPQG